jgi:hypothetical protein
MSEDSDASKGLPWYLKPTEMPPQPNKSGAQVPLVSFPFLGDSLGKGNRQGFVDVMKKAQQKLVDQMLAEVDASLSTAAERAAFRTFFFDANATKGKAYFNKWCQLTDANRGWQRNSDAHHDGRAIDVNYNRCPYIPTRVGEGETMNGENQPAQHPDVKEKIWIGCRDAYDRAYHLFYASRATKAHVNRSKAAIKTTYAELQRLNWSLRMYFDYVYAWTKAAALSQYAGHPPVRSAAVMWKKLKNDQLGIETDDNGDPIPGKQGAPKLHPNAMFFVDDKSKLPGIDAQTAPKWWIEAPSWPGRRAVLLSAAPQTGAEADAIAAAVRAQIVIDHGAVAKGMVMGDLAADGSSWMLRDPCGGFLSVSYDVVVAMMESGSGCWAMFAFGGTSGVGLDVMHFDIESPPFIP